MYKLSIKVHFPHEYRDLFGEKIKIKGGQKAVANDLILSHQIERVQ